MQDKLAAQLAKLKTLEAENAARENAAAEKLKKLRVERKELSMQLSALERRVRNHRLIETGAIVEKFSVKMPIKASLPGF